MVYEICRRTIPRIRLVFCFIFLVYGSKVGSILDGFKQPNVEVVNVFIDEFEVRQELIDLGADRNEDEDH